MPEPGRETLCGVAFLDQALVRLSVVQNGVFGLDQLRALGITPSGVRARRAAGRLHRIHQTVYSLVPKELLKRDGLYMAAVLACGEGAVLSHRSAAALHGLRDWGYTKIEVTVPRRSARRHEGVKVHRSTTLPEKDVTVVNGIPCTTIVRTLLDLAEVVTRRELERAFDQGEIIEGLDLNAINDQIARNPTAPAPNAAARSSRRTTSAGLPRRTRTRRRYWRSPGHSGSRIRSATRSSSWTTAARRSSPTSSGASSAWSSRPTATSGTTRANDSS